MKTIDQATPIIDEVIAEVRCHKRAIIEEHGNDVDALLRDLQRRQQANPLLVSDMPAKRRVRGRADHPG